MRLSIIAAAMALAALALPGCEARKVTHYLDLQQNYCPTIQEQDTLSSCHMIMMLYQAGKVCELL